MPGIFRGIGSVLEKYEALTCGFESIWGSCEVFSVQTSIIGGHGFDGKSTLYERGETLHFAVDGEASIYRNVAYCAQSY